jgi:hypothetical protein
MSASGYKQTFSHLVINLGLAPNADATGTIGKCPLITDWGHHKFGKLPTLPSISDQNKYPNCITKIE